jgi:hypothetical protein
MSLTEILPGNRHDAVHYFHNVGNTVRRLHWKGPNVCVNCKGQNVPTPSFIQREVNRPPAHPPQELDHDLRSLRMPATEESPLP